LPKSLLQQSLQQAFFYRSLLTVYLANIA